MADQALRDLERKAAAGDAHAALDLARARVRAGDHVAALEAVWQACAEPGLRDEAALVTLDLAPPRTAPRIAWQTKLRRGIGDLQINSLGLVVGANLLDPADGHPRLESMLDASPLAVRSGAELLDPVRSRAPGARQAGHTWLDGARVVVATPAGRDSVVVQFDAWEGVEVKRWKVPGQVLTVGAGVIVMRQTDGVVALSGEPAAAPIELWRRPVTPGALTAAVAGTTVALWHRRSVPETQERLELLSIGDGAVQGTFDGVRLTQLDDEGLLGEVRVDGPSLPATPAALDRKGQPAWYGAPGWTLVGRSRNRVLYARATLHGTEQRSELLAVERATGALLGSLVTTATVSCIVGDVLITGSHEVAASTLTGDSLWSWDLVGSVTGLACLPGRVYVLDGTTVTCLVGA